jgi:hypothetical protein
MTNLVFRSGQLGPAHSYWNEAQRFHPSTIACGSHVTGSTRPMRWVELLLRTNWQGRQTVTKSEPSVMRSQRLRRNFGEEPLILVCEPAPMTEAQRVRHVDDSGDIGRLGTEQVSCHV